MKEDKEEHEATLFSKVIEIKQNKEETGPPKHNLTRLQRAAIL